METDDQHFALKASPEQAVPLRAPSHCKHSGSPSVQVMEPFKDQGRNRVSLAVSLQQVHPGPSDLCVRLTALLAGLQSLVDPSTDVGPNIASLLPSLTCEFPLT